MTTCNEIDRTLEDYRNEAERTAVHGATAFHGEDGDDRLGREIAALANRDGGRILVGVESGDRYADPDAFDLETERERVERICDALRPALRCTVELLACPEGRVLVINVPRRAGSPHAWARDDGSRKRFHPVRTAEGGTAELSADQIEWLSEHPDDPDVSFGFRIVLLRAVDRLELPEVDGQPPCASAYRRWLERLPAAEREALAATPATARHLLADLTPYTLLEAVCRVSREVLPRHPKSSRDAGDGLLRRLARAFGFGASGRRLDRRLQHLAAVPATSPLADAGWDLERTLLDRFGPDLPLRRPTELQVDHFPSRVRSQLALVHPQFSVNFLATLAGEDGDGSPGRPDTDDLEPVVIDGRLTSAYRFPEGSLEPFRRQARLVDRLRDELVERWDCAPGSPS